MKKLSSVLLKLAVFSALLAQLAFASDAEVATQSAISEPLYLSLCGLILLTFGLLKNRNEEKDI